MKRRPCFFALVLLTSWLRAAEPASELPPTPGWAYTELRRVPAAEARQGVAADEEFFYAINNFALGKYRKDTGERIASWECPEGQPLTHLNAGIVHKGRLYVAHSNYPGVPMLSSVEIWDTRTMQHVGSHSFGRTDGSLTWIDWRNGRWIACFAHYGRKGGEPGRGPEWTRIVEFDDNWRQTGAWALPADLLAHISGNGYSCSGGAFGPGGFLYVTGHDNTELYVLDFPTAGPGVELGCDASRGGAGTGFLLGSSRQEHHSHAQPHQPRNRQRPGHDSRRRSGHRCRNREVKDRLLGPD